MTPQLKYKWLYDDLLVFKNQNDCMTISRNNYMSTVEVASIEIDGEKLVEDEGCYYDLRYHSDNTFTEEEIEYYIKFYEEQV